jgi:hypothetical protein
MNSYPTELIDIFIVLEARGLNSTVVGDSVPDPYVQVSIGYEVFRTETVWNSFDPTFDDTFSS